VVIYLGFDGYGIKALLNSLVAPDPGCGSDQIENSHNLGAQ
jgi:hypothetical protein